MTAVVGGALPTKEALEAKMKELGMLDLTPEEREANARAAFEAVDPDTCPLCDFPFFVSRCTACGYTQGGGQ